MGTARTNLLLALGLLIAVFTIQYFLRMDSRPSPDSLAELALNAESSDAQQRAAIQLADYGDGAQEHLRRVFGESTSDTVRMICIDGFGATWDYDSMGTLLDSIEDPSSEVRGRAAQVIAKLTGRDRRFRANGLEEERALLLRHMREDWEEIRNSPHMDELVRRLKESHEKRKK